MFLAYENNSKPVRFEFYFINSSNSLDLLSNQSSVFFDKCNHSYNATTRAPENEDSSPPVTR